jgi:hypothetical protein
MEPLFRPKLDPPTRPKNKNIYIKNIYLNPVLQILQLPKDPFNRADMGNKINFKYGL